MINVEQTIISQYANSATIVGLIGGFNECIDPRADIQAFFDFVWNVETAQGFGLDIWGKIVGIGREMPIPADIDYFGFDVVGGEYTPMNEAPMYNGDPETAIFSLTDDAYRKLILAKALSNISRCTVPAINLLLNKIFPGRGPCYVADTGNMRMHYTFEFFLLPFERVIVDQLGVLPRPAGVELGETLIIVTSFFGFIEMGTYSTPFGESAFWPGGAISIPGGGESSWTDRDVFTDSEYFFD